MFWWEVDIGEIFAIAWFALCKDNN